jgi:hypothetical protein
MKAYLKFANVLFLAFLGAAVAAQTWDWQPRMTGEAHESLATLIPSSHPGFVVKDVPIYDTEEMRQRVVEYLNYSDAIFRVYKSPRFELGVYLAYWEPGRMSHRLVAGHTPDICWVGSGWKRTERIHNYAFSFPAPGGDAREIRLAPAQYGVYEVSTQRQHVFFWHVVGDRLEVNMHGDKPKWNAFLSDLVEYGFEQRAEQYFVRISCDKPFEEIRNDSLFRSILLAVSKYGLRVESGAFALKNPVAGSE